MDVWCSVVNENGPVVQFSVGNRKFLDADEFEGAVHYCVFIN